MADNLWDSRLRPAAAGRKPQFGDGNFAAAMVRPWGGHGAAMGRPWGAMGGAPRPARIDANAGAPASAGQPRLFNRSRISASSASLALGAGGGAASAGSLFFQVFSAFTSMKITKASRMKLMTIVMKLP